MTEQNAPSAFAGIRALRDELRARLDRTEDFRGWKALDEALRELELPAMPRAVELVVAGASAPAGQDFVFGSGRRDRA